MQIWLRGKMVSLLFTKHLSIRLQFTRGTIEELLTHAALMHSSYNTFPQSDTQEYARKLYREKNEGYPNHSYWWQEIHLCMPQNLQSYCRVLGSCLLYDQFYSPLSAYLLRCYIQALLGAQYLTLYIFLEAFIKPCEKIRDYVWIGVSEEISRKIMDPFFLSSVILTVQVT